MTQGGKQGGGIMLISSASVEMLKIPVTDGYQAAGRAVDANWHVLVRVRTADGIEGVGYIVQPRGDLMQTIASGAAASAFSALREGFALRSLAFLAHSIAIARRSPLSLLTRAARFLTCGADFLCLPVRWSGLLVWRLRFAKPAPFLLFLFVAPIVLLSMCGHTSMAVELRLQRERCDAVVRAASAVQRCAAMQVRALQQP